MQYRTCLRAHAIKSTAQWPSLLHRPASHAVHFARSPRKIQTDERSLAWASLALCMRYAVCLCNVCIACFAKILETFQNSIVFVSIRGDRIFLFSPHSFGVAWIERYKFPEKPICNQTITSGWSSSNSPHCILHIHFVSKSETTQWRLPFSMVCTLHTGTDSGTQCQY